MSAETFVIVDRNAIYENERDGGDRPPLVVHSGTQGCTPAHELVIRSRAGDIVARFKSQSLRCPGHRERPHVWFELEGGTIELVKR